MTDQMDPTTWPDNDMVAPAGIEPDDLVPEPSTEFAVATPAAGPTPAPRRVSRLRIAVCALSVVLVVGAAVALFVGSGDRDDARRDRDHARAALIAQRAATRTAHARLATTEHDAQAVNTMIPTPLGTTQNLAALGDAGLAAAGDAQQAGIADQSDAYNAAVSRGNAIVDQFNAALAALDREAQDLLGQSTQSA